MQVAICVARLLDERETGPHGRLLDGRQNHPVVRLRTARAGRRPQQSDGRPVERQIVETARKSSRRQTEGRRIARDAAPAGADH